MMKMIKTTSMAKRVMKKLTKMRMARGIRKKVRGGGGGGEVRRDSWWCMVTIVNIAEDDYFNVDDFFFTYFICLYSLRKNVICQLPRHLKVSNLKFAIQPHA